MTWIFYKLWQDFIKICRILKSYHNLVGGDVKIEVMIKFEKNSDYYRLDTLIIKLIESLKKVNKLELEYIIVMLLKIFKKPMTKSQILDELYFLKEIDKEKLSIILSYYSFIHYDDVHGYYYSKEEKTLANNILDIINKIKFLEKKDISTLIYNLFTSIGEPLRLNEIENYISITGSINRKELKEVLERTNKIKSIGHETYALIEWNKYKESDDVPDKKTILAYDDLYTSVLNSIKSLKIVNQYKLEYLVYKLLKHSRYSMTKSQILDELYFLKEIDNEKLDIILSYYSFIHYHDVFGYYYSKEEKSIENNFLDILKKLKYLNCMEITSCIYNLLISIGQPMSLDEIYDYISVIKEVDKEELEIILKNSNKFKSVKYKTYALAEWDEYGKLYYDFDKDITSFLDKSKIKKRNWEIYKKYVFSLRDYTLEEIGNIYNITRERVRQIVRKIDKRIEHFSCRKRFIKYVDLVENLIIENGVLDFSNEHHIKELKKIFENRNLIEVIAFLNKIENKFIVLEDRYCYLKSKYDYIISYLDYLVEKINDSYVCMKTFDSIFSELKIDKNREKELLKLIINNDKRFYINADKDICYYSKEPFSKYSIIWIIFDEIGEPVHYSVVMKKYNEITGDNINSHIFLSYLDRREDLFTRIFTGIYGLKKWGYNKHIFSTDLVVKLLEFKKSVMHYEDIYECIKHKTMAKKKTVYTLMQADERIVSLGCGYYCLKSYFESNSGNLEYFSNNADISKRRLGYLLAKLQNEYGNTVIKYRVIESMLNSYSIKIPKVFDIELEYLVYLFDIHYNKYQCKFNKDLNELYGMTVLMRRKEISVGDILYLEIISPKAIRLLTEYEYEHEYQVFDSKKYSEYIEVEENADEDDVIEIVDLESLMKFGLKNGFIYYEDLEKIDISDKYDDIYELMIELNEKGITFLNKG